MKTNEKKSDATSNPATGSEARAKRVRSDVLLGEGKELIIEHGGREYRLRQTSTGKLILTA